MKTFFLVACAVFISSCSGCFEEEPAKVASGTILLNQMPKQLPMQPARDGQPNVRVINIGPSKDVVPETVSSSQGQIPKEVTIDSSLTARLKEKLAEAFGGRNSPPPDIEIYTGTMSLEQFSKYYEDRGFKIQRTSVPASQIIAPLLDEKPELADKVSLANYAGVTINQVIVEGANISAADKYIDPETYQIVYKTFVTNTKMR